MLALGEEQTAKIFTLMDDEEIKEISQTMAKLGTVSADLVEKLFVEFADQISATGSLIGTLREHRAPARQGARQRARRRPSWRRSAVPPAAPCGTSSAT